MQKQTEELLARSPELDKGLYFTVGNEGEEMVGASRAYAEMLRARASGNLRWRFEEMDRENHGTIVHRAAYRGLEQVFDGWAAPDSADTLDALERHYSSLSVRFRFRVRAPEARVNLLGYRLMAAGKMDDALAAFRRNVELYPDSANVYDSLGEALERKGDVAQAIQNYELAVRHAARNRDPAVELFLNRLAAARNRASARQ
jgi:tetratricopeptide (TPR) repeat protein